jgi:hypothetical protein
MRSSFFQYVKELKKKPGFLGPGFVLIVFFYFHITKQSTARYPPSLVQTKCSFEGYIYYDVSLFLNLKMFMINMLKFFFVAIEETIL